MFRTRTLIGFLALIACLALTIGTAAADSGGGKGQGRTKPVKARISWSVARVEQAMTAGQTSELTVMVTSNVDAENVRLRIPGGLGRIVRVEPDSLASLKAGVATPIKLIISMPADRAHSQSGVIQVRVGNRMAPPPLRVKVTLPRADGADAD